MTINADELITQKHKRNFIQFNGASPANPVKYAGQNAQYMAIEGVTLPETGGADPIWVHDPRQVGRYKLVARQISAPDLASATLLMHEKHGSIPRQLLTMGCRFNLYEVTGNCEDLSDFLNGWSDYVLIYSGALVDSKDLGSRTSWDSDDAMEDSLSLTLDDIYPVGSISFGEGATTQVDLEVIDIVYHSKFSCGECGIVSDGTQLIYGVTKDSGSGSPGMPSEIVYSLDGGANWFQANIAGWTSASDQPLAIDIVGNYLVVLSSNGAYFYAAINTSTGVPGTFTKVSSGFDGSHKPLDMFVSNSTEVWFSAEDGYVYFSDNITAGVEVKSAGSATSADLTRIHGDKNDTIVCFGVGGVVIKSINRGLTWATTTTSPSADDGTAVCVLTSKRFWLGSGGHLYYTLDGGESWVEVAFSGSGAGVLYDIIFPTAEVGWFSHSTATPTARIFGTFNGGADWTMTAPRVMNLPVFDYAHRLAFPDTFAGVAANNLAVAGLAGNATDGIILVGTATKL